MKSSSEKRTVSQIGLEDSDDHLADPPANSIELYERWRAGLIRRHITANGRLDENVFLQERGQRYTPGSEPRPRIDFNRRRATESWTPAPGSDDSSTTAAGPAEKIWWLLGGERGEFPTTFSDDNRDRFELGNTWGGGDNPLLSGGLALALFSMEQMMDVSQHSFDYARMLFRYIASQEKWPGFFLRAGVQLKDASTDELCGLCIGLYFYHKACGHRGDVAEGQMVKELISRMAQNLNSHGYWLLPPSSEAFPDYPYIDRRPKLENQRAWVFAYVLRIFFARVAGVVTDPSWDESELHFYFGYKLGDPRRLTQWPPPMFDGIVNAFEVDWVENANVDQSSFFHNLLSLLSVSPEVEAVPGLGPSDIKPYNFHMIGLMSLLLLELVQEGAEPNASETYALVAEAFAGILGLEKHKENAFYGLLSVRGRQLLMQELPSTGVVAAAIGVLADVRRWQHDLPLGEIKVLNMLHTVDPAEPREEYGSKEKPKPLLPENILKSIAHNCGSDWLKEFRSWKLPLTYNPNDLWGECRTWEHFHDSHIYTRKWKRKRAALTEGPGYAVLVQALFDHPGLDVKIEGCGLDFLLARMLAAWWGVMETPVLARDARWKTLPFSGKDGGWCFWGTYGYLRTHCHSYSGPIEYAGIPVDRTLMHLRGASKVLQDEKHFPYRRVQSSRVPLPLNSWAVCGHEGKVCGGNGRFRGRREFHYDDKAHYYLHAPKADIGWADVYLQFSTMKDVFDRKLPLLDWCPPSHHRLHNFGSHPVQDLLLETAVGTTKWTDEFLASQGLDGTSFIFYRFKARVTRVGPLLPAQMSVGNEMIRFDGSVRSHWRRLNVLPTHAKHHYFLNPHTGVIHDSRAAHGATLRCVARSRNILLLPVPVTLDISSLNGEQLETLVGNIIATGVPRLAETTRRLFLKRRDRYSLPYVFRYVAPTSEEKYLPYPRLRAYLSTRPAAKVRYEMANSRYLRLCSHCFPLWKR